MYEDINKYKKLLESAEKESPTILDEQYIQEFINANKLRSIFKNKEARMIQQYTKRYFDTIYNKYENFKKRIKRDTRMPVTIYDNEFVVSFLKYLRIGPAISKKVLAYHKENIDKMNDAFSPLRNETADTILAKSKEAKAALKADGIKAEKLMTEILKYSSLLVVEEYFDRHPTNISDNTKSLLDIFGRGVKGNASGRTKSNLDQLLNSFFSNSKGPRL